MLGTYFSFTFPKLVSWIGGIILGALILVLVLGIMVHVAIFGEQIKRL
jgi:hypothetical protein